MAIRTLTSLPVGPDRESFDRLAERWPLVPMWTELLADAATPVSLFHALTGTAPGALLESVERSEQWGRYSSVACDPAGILSVDERGVRVERQSRELPFASIEQGTGPMEALKSLAAQLRTPRLPDLPPIIGGLVGFVAYEAASLLDGGPRLPPADGPAMRFLLTDRAAVFDHWRQRLLLVAHVSGKEGHTVGVRALEDLADRVASTGPLPLEAIDVAASPLEARSNMEDERFLEGVRRIKERIANGDIFQAVLSRRLSVPAPQGGLSIYRRLRVTNPAPYMFFLRLPGLELAGSSPEPLVRVQGRRVVSRPIAGTRPRGGDPSEDLRLERDLLADPKERAEHAMLVDLARNDLGRVCRPGTVTPTELFQVKRFSRVMHLVSTVEGELLDGLTALDALAAAFPAGTVTGAPKRRAMEIIAENEPTPRGPYAGAVGYLGFDGDLDFCITIRTAEVSNGVAHIQAGAGVVADSDPHRELAETEAKAAAVLAAARASEGSGR